MKNYLKYCLLLTEVSSIVLLVLTLLYVLSGYGIVRTSIVRKLTFNLINRHVAERIHHDIFLRLLFNIFLLVHCLSGLILLIYRRVKNDTFRYILITISILIPLYLLLPLMLIDLIDLLK
ncbi:MAG: hypothetical protein QXX35_02755 [Desulfurococcaceae archaeon]